MHVPFVEGSYAHDDAGGEAVFREDDGLVRGVQLIDDAVVGRTDIGDGPDDGDFVGGWEHEERPFIAYEV